MVNQAMDSRINSAADAPLIELLNADIAMALSPGNVLIEGANWCLEPGEFWVIAGLPESGKSDFLATAAGLQRPARGGLNLFGRDLATASELERVSLRIQLGLVFEMGSRLLHSLTVIENVVLPYQYHRNCSFDEARGRAWEILEALELAPHAGVTPGRLSRNWQQRVGLARALVLSPQALLLDNPLVMLGPTHVRWWLDFLPRLVAGHPLCNNRPMAVVATCDDLHPWLDAARQLAMIRNRRFVPAGGRQNWPAHSEPWMRDLLSVTTALPKHSVSA